ncbi:putative FAD-containing monooxygenase [Corynespora cassiicola Philippines]|uniref:Putative FAD-containing monooxygenase n=1 Tax=Corynespora cassiicola Philippines TaxID=1448308 RepID=A0A2T2N410_CORCC|nr:putative FAD-containing monooxygenase [Corynespora cassiicola Philippines]
MPSANETSTNRKRHVVVIGAGVSGILIAHHFQKYLSDGYTLEILEKNSDVGGTWLENTYPGCACDVPSDIYQYSFAPTKDWSSIYSSSNEIQAYLAQVVDHFGLRQYIHFDTVVKQCAWQEEGYRWSVESQGAHGAPNKRHADILINACGVLNHYKFPDIPGLKGFEGSLLHTANWDHTVELKDKSVAVIGAGASAVQLIPQIQPIVKSLSVYIRTPSWITQPYLPSDTSEEGNSPESYLQRCKAYEGYFNKLFPVFYRDSETQEQKRNTTAQWMHERIKDEGLRQNLIPQYELGCRRMNPGESFLDAVQASNVKCIFGDITSCGPLGLKSGGETNEVDVIVAATGFDTSFRPRFPIIGRNNVDIRDLWQEDPSAYLGIGCAGFPNYMTMLGPNCPVANGSLIGSLEAIADFTVRLLKRVHRFDVSSFVPDERAQEDFNEYINEFMSGMVWTGSCTSWYKRGYNGKVTAVWPGSSLHHREMLELDRWEDWAWTYHKRRHAIWGDGRSTIEINGGDYSYYLHHGSLLSRVVKETNGKRKFFLD